MDGWVGGRTDIGWMDGWVDGQADGYGMDGWMDGWRWDGWLDRQMDTGWLERGTGGRMGEGLKQATMRCVAGYKDGRTGEGIQGWKSGRRDGWGHEQVDIRMDR